ncbi:hypothetical protein [Streptomyces sp. PSAA01]|uniref:hypothetical protein n=1 Tax=Streptomyces sp. PSAA01 TaxID=2912762 RepID=UPI001F46878C|nr:hypothetical protein [Streptomyces sp. PSAA01]MCG0288031.1 hypothetical protein [Streptomyces sp. PSAA01]
MRRRTRLALLGTAAALAVGTGLAVSDRDEATARTEDVIVGQGADHLPNRSASDWVTYADHVVVVSATGEKEIAPTQQEVERGEGTVGLTVALTVDKVVWSRPDAHRPAPDTWEYSAMGWQFQGGDTGNRTKMALVDQPRVEPGHRYVMAIRWEAATCSPGDDPEPAQRRGLGEGSEVPFDAGVIGQGELEGRSRTAAQARSAKLEAGDDAGLEDQVAGRGEDALVQELKAAQPHEPETFGPARPRDACA